MQKGAERCIKGDFRPGELSTEEFAEAVGRSVKTVYQWLKRGLISETERSPQGYRRFTRKQLGEARALLARRLPGRYGLGAGIGG
jgi:transposase